MKIVTTRVDTDTHEKIEERAEETDASKSAVARDLLKLGLRADEIRQERDRLQKQLAATNSRVDEHKELVAYVEEQRDLERSRARREEQRAQAGIVTRAKWLLMGMSSEDD